MYLCCEHWEVHQSLMTRKVNFITNVRKFALLVSTQVDEQILSTSFQCLEEWEAPYIHKGGRRWSEPCGICKLEGVGASPLIVKWNVEIVLKLKFQITFRHSKSSYFKNLWIKKSWKINIFFISKNPFEISRLHSKVIDEH